MKRKNSVTTVSAVGFLAMVNGYAVASADSKLNWSGFASATVTNVSGNAEKYLSQFDTDSEEYSNTRLGLNLSSTLSSEMSVAGQILMAGREEDYNAHADWVFLTYSPSQLNKTRLKLGRIKFPTLLFSDIYDVGYAYPWVNTPQTMYNLSALGPVATHEVMSGVALTRQGYMRGFDWEAEVFMGKSETGIGEVEDIRGLVLTVDRDETRLKLGWHSGRLGEGDGGHEEGITGEIGEHTAETLLEADEQVLNVSFSTLIQNWTFHAEFVSVDWRGGNSAADVDLFDSDSWYISAMYTADALSPYVLYEDMSEKGGLAQQGLTIGLRYELNHSTAVKLEWSDMDISPRDNPVMVENAQGQRFFESGLAVLPFGSTEDQLTIVNLSFDVIF